MQAYPDATLRPYASAKAPFATAFNNETHVPEIPPPTLTVRLDKGEKMRRVVSGDPRIPPTPFISARRAPLGGHITTAIPYAKEATLPFPQHATNVPLPSTLRQHRQAGDKVLYTLALGPQVCIKLLLETSFARLTSV